MDKHAEYIEIQTEIENRVIHRHKRIELYTITAKPMDNS